MTSAGKPLRYFTDKLNENFELRIIGFPIS